MGAGHGWLEATVGATGGLDGLAALPAGLEVGAHLTPAWSVFGAASASLAPAQPFGWQVGAGVRSAW